LGLSTNGTNAVYIDSSQNVGIGATSPAVKLHVAKTTGSGYVSYLSSGVNVSGSDNGLFIGGYDENSGSKLLNIQTNTITPDGAGYKSRFVVQGDGSVLVGTTSQLPGSTSKLVVDYATGDFVAGFRNSNASPLGLYVFHSTDVNGGGNPFIYCVGGLNVRFSFKSNGGINNFSANNTNLSDRREKINFAPAKSYLNTICSIPVQTFNYIDQSEDDPGLTLGVVAQDVQAVAPEMVTESNWGTEEAPKMRLSIYQTDLQYALMKSIQELKAINDTQAELISGQAATINALVTRIEALENRA
jgi:hypothetical protein